MSSKTGTKKSPNNGGQDKNTRKGQTKKKKKTKKVSRDLKIEAEKVASQTGGESTDTVSPGESVQNISYGI